MKIDKMVLVPDVKYHKGTKSLLLKMCVGDSILVETRQLINSLRASAHDVASESGRKHITKKVEGGWRLWRVE